MNAVASWMDSRTASSAFEFTGARGHFRTISDVPESPKPPMPGRKPTNGLALALNRDRRPNFQPHITIRTSVLICREWKPDLRGVREV